MKIPIADLAAIIIIALSAILYLTWFKNRYGTRKSISITFKTLEGKQRILFSLFIWGVALPNIELAINGTDPIKWYLILASALLCLVGVFVIITKKLYLVMHVLGATGGILVDGYSFWVESNFKIPVYVYAGIVVLILIFTRKTRVYHIEKWAIIVHVLAWCYLVYPKEVL